MTLCDQVLDDPDWFAPDEAARVRDVLQRWQAANGTARKLIDNLCTDPRLPADARAALMRAMSSHQPPGDWETAKGTYESVCHTHLRRGGECTKLPKKRQVWRAVEPETMKRQLDKAHWTPDAVAAIVGHLYTEPWASEWDWTWLPSHEPLGPYQMWATWNPGEEAEWPPFPPAYRADHIRACLGLSDLDRGKELFLLGYRLPADWTAWIPTVADAGTFPYFKPNLMGFDYGLTDPWHPRPDLTDSSGQPFQGAPCPEAIHDPICADHLYLVKHVWK